MMQTMKLVEYKRFISNFDKNKIKELEDEIKNLNVKNNVNDK